MLPRPAGQLAVAAGVADADQQRQQLRAGHARVSEPRAQSWAGKLGLRAGLDGPARLLVSRSANFRI